MLRQYLQAIRSRTFLAISRPSMQADSTEGTEEKATDSSTGVSSGQATTTFSTPASAVWISNGANRANCGPLTSARNVNVPFAIIFSLPSGPAPLASSRGCLQLRDLTLVLFFPQPLESSQAMHDVPRRAA